MQRVLLLFGMCRHQIHQMVQMGHSWLKTNKKLFYRFLIKTFKEVKINTDKFHEIVLIEELNGTSAYLFFQIVANGL